VEVPPELISTVTGGVIEEVRARWAFMREKLIIDLFQAVDSRDWNALRTILHPEIAYERPGYKRLERVSQVMRFYEHERILVSGKHDTECALVVAAMHRKYLY
jgi:hypothetical protein